MICEAKFCKNLQFATPCCKMPQNTAKLDCVINAYYAPGRAVLLPAPVLASPANPRPVPRCPAPAPRPGPALGRPPARPPPAVRRRPRAVHRRCGRTPRRGSARGGPGAPLPLHRGVLPGPGGPQRCLRPGVPPSHSYTWPRLRHPAHGSPQPWTELLNQQHL